jgi:hypothetical protein
MNVDQRTPRVFSDTRLFTQRGKSRIIHKQQVQPLPCISTIVTGKIKWQLIHLLNVTPQCKSLKRWPSTLAQYGTVNHTIGLHYSRLTTPMVPLVGLKLARETHTSIKLNAHTQRRHTHRKRVEQVNLRPDRTTAGETLRKKKDEPGLTRQPSNRHHLAATWQTQWKKGNMIDYTKTD